MLAIERVLSLVARPELAAGACCELLSSVSEGGRESRSEAMVLLLSLDTLVGSWLATGC